MQPISPNDRTLKRHFARMNEFMFRKGLLDGCGTDALTSQTFADRPDYGETFGFVPEEMRKIVYRDTLIMLCHKIRANDLAAFLRNTQKEACRNAMCMMLDDSYRRGLRQSCRASWAQIQEITSQNDDCATFVKVGEEGMFTDWLSYLDYIKHRANMLDERRRLAGRPPKCLSLIRWLRCG